MDRAEIGRAMSVACLRSLAIAAGALLAALGLAGCANQLAQSDASETTRVAAAPPLPVEAPAQPKPKQKSAALKKSATYTVAAGQAPARQPDGEASCTVVEACASVLKDMVADTDRTWIDRPAKPAVMANGVRLFTYRVLRTKLSCNELTTALSEVEAAQRTFSRPIGDLQPEQAQRVKSLSLEVGEELRTERARRCAPKVKDGPIGSAPPTKQG